jgi:hypothetical protein
MLISISAGNTNFGARRRMKNFRRTTPSQRKSLEKDAVPTAPPSDMDSHGKLPRRARQPAIVAAAAMMCGQAGLQFFLLDEQ